MVKFVPSLLNQKKLTFTETLLLGKKLVFFSWSYISWVKLTQWSLESIVLAKLWAIGKTLIVQNTNFCQITKCQTVVKVWSYLQIAPILAKANTLLINVPGLTIWKFNPNWHEAGRIYSHYNFWIGFCQLNIYQKFPNNFGGENWDQSG